MKHKEREKEKQINYKEKERLTKAPKKMLKRKCQNEGQCSVECKL